MLDKARAENNDSKLYQQQKEFTDKLRDDDKIAGIASIGLIDLWDSEQGMNDVQSYLEI